MKLIFAKEFKRAYQKLPEKLRKRVDKQLLLLEKDFRYPSLRTKKMEGAEDVWEGRVTVGYRMRFKVSGDEATMLTVGQHDTGLGKK